ncbi:hypothetical protein SK128_014921 [Halocaridina rubra]|uniref:Uncharacterized protein n=1 Tax=Halocaridina rubra TaxID=373956 RepID=A0AAN8XP16_HALRR
MEGTLKGYRLLLKFWIYGMYFLGGLSHAGNKKTFSFSEQQRVFFLSSRNPVKHNSTAEQAEQQPSNFGQLKRNRLLMLWSAFVKLLVLIFYAVTLYVYSTDEFLRDKITHLQTNNVFEVLIEILLLVTSAGLCFYLLTNSEKLAKFLSHRARIYNQVGADDDIKTSPLKNPAANDDTIEFNDSSQNPSFGHWKLLLTFIIVYVIGTAYLVVTMNNFDASISNQNYYRASKINFLFSRLLTMIYTIGYHVLVTLLVLQLQVLEKSIALHPSPKTDTSKATEQKASTDNWHFSLARIHGTSLKQQDPPDPEQSRKQVQVHNYQQDCNYETKSQEFSHFILGKEEFAGCCFLHSTNLGHNYKDYLGTRNGTYSNDMQTEEDVRTLSRKINQFHIYQDLLTDYYSTPLLLILARTVLLIIYAAYALSTQEFKLDSFEYIIYFIQFLSTLLVIFYPLEMIRTELRKLHFRVSQCRLETSDPSLQTQSSKQTARKKSLQQASHSSEKREHHEKSHPSSFIGL